MATKKTITVTIYKLAKDGEITPAGRRTLYLRTVENYEQTTASSKLTKLRLRCVEIGGELYKVEKEAGRDAVFLPSRVRIPANVKAAA